MKENKSMKKLAIIYFFAFWVMDLLSDYVYWIMHGETLTTSNNLAIVIYAGMWFGGTLAIWFLDKE